MEQQTIRIKYHSNEIEKLTYIDGKRLDRSSLSRTRCIKKRRI